MISWLPGIGTFLVIVGIPRLLIISISCPVLGLAVGGFLSGLVLSRLVVLSISWGLWLGSVVAFLGIG